MSRRAHELRAVDAARGAAPSPHGDLISALGGVREALRLLARGDGPPEERRALAIEGLRNARRALRIVDQLRAAGDPRPEVAARREALARELLADRDRLLALAHQRRAGDGAELGARTAHVARVVAIGRARRR